jgi:hypothetical protein
MSYEQDIATKVRAPIAEVEALDSRTLTGNVTITRFDGKFHVMDPGGAHRDVTLYAGGPEDVGRSEYFYNAADAAENLVIKDSGASTLITLGQSQWAQVICNEALAPAPTVVDMADAAGALVYGTAGAGEFKVTSNIIQVDPNSGQASEILTLPPVATSVGVMLVLINTGGEGVVVKDVATATIITLDTTQNGLVVCDGTNWRGFMGAIT